MCRDVKSIPMEKLDILLKISFQRLQLSPCIALDLEAKLKSYQPSKLKYS
jgi:hypothetical protein